MIMALDWISAENERACSPLYHKLGVTKIANGGQSCGGMMTLDSAGDKRLVTSVVSNSGLSGNNATLFASYHNPMLFIAGGSSDFLSSSATANVNTINNVPSADRRQTDPGDLRRVVP
jgi:dienelactone hydrolase